MPGIPSWMKRNRSWSRCRGTCIVRSAGGGTSPGAPGPSPLPSLPWHTWQFCRYTTSPVARESDVGGKGLRSCSLPPVNNKNTPTTKAAAPGATTPIPSRKFRPPKGMATIANTNPSPANPMPSSVRAVSGEGVMSALPPAPVEAASNRKAVRASNASERTIVSSACQTPAMLIWWSSSTYVPSPTALAETAISPRSDPR